MSYSNYPQSYAGYSHFVSSGPPPPPGMMGQSHFPPSTFSAYQNYGPYGGPPGYMNQPAVQNCYQQQSYPMGDIAPPPQVPPPPSLYAQINPQAEAMRELQMQSMIYERMRHEKQGLPMQTPSAPSQEMMGQEPEAAPKEDTAQKEIDAEMKEKMKMMYVDELMRRYTLSGTFEMATGTITALVTYPREDPVVAFYKGTTGEDLTDKPWNAEADCEYLRKSMKGLGTQEDMITHIVSTRSNTQRQELKAQFAAQYGRDLIEDIKGELSGDYKSSVLACFVSPAYYDALCIRDAIEGLGTDEEVLIEILMTRTNKQLEEIRNVYGEVRSKNKRSHSNDIDKDIKGDTSGHFKKLLLSASQGRRTMLSRGEVEGAVVEITNDMGQGTGMYQLDYSKLVNGSKAKAEAKRLYDAGEDRWGTDEEIFNQIFSLRHIYQLRATYAEYVKLTQHSIINAVKSETSGDFKAGLKAIIESVENRPAFFARRLQVAMKGLGTDEKSLIRLVTSRSEIDMVQVKEQFLKQTKMTLWRYIKEDTSCNFRKLLLAIVKKD